MHMFIHVSIHLSVNKFVCQFIGLAASHPACLICSCSMYLLLFLFLPWQVQIQTESSVFPVNCLKNSVVLMIP